ncbi:hypothetical protein VTO73DRAFT_10293 [Trametes versicolor]
MPVPPVHIEADPANAGAFPIKLPALDDTMGALLVGTFIGLILLGITLHQAYRYARIFPNDSSWLKGLVAFVVLLEIISSGLTMHACYYYMVTNYFNPQDLGVSVWSANIHATVAGATMVISQSFFARRVWILDSRYRPVVTLCCVLSLAELGVFVASTVMEFVTDSPVNTTYLHLPPTGFCLAMAADLMLTVSLIHILRRKRTGFTGTDKMIDVLVMYSVNTGLLNGYRDTIIICPYTSLTVRTRAASVFDLLTTIFAFVRPRSIIWGIFAIAGAKLYAITLLTALHSRSTFRVHGPGEVLQDGDTVFGVSFPSELAKAAPPSGSNAAASPRRDQIKVHQTRSTSTIDGEDAVELKVISPTLP